jgi:hypothetical protein
MSKWDVDSQDNTFASGGIIDRERRELKDKLSLDVATFISQGGVIQQIPAGVTEINAKETDYSPKNNKEKHFKNYTWLKRKERQPIRFGSGKPAPRK